MERQIPQQVAYFNTPNLLDHHPPYIPPCIFYRLSLISIFFFLLRDYSLLFTNHLLDFSVQVAGLAPGPSHEENGLDLQWSFGLDSKKKRPTEQVFLENNLNNNNSNNNSQISSVDLLQARSVSTGLGLSLENPRLTSSGDSALIGLVGDALDRELQRQDAEIDRYIKLQVRIGS